MMVCRIVMRAALVEPGGWAEGGSASSDAVFSQRRRACIICSRLSATSLSLVDCATQEHWNI